MLFAFPQMDFQFPLVGNVFCWLSQKGRHVMCLENVTARIHAEAAWKFTFQAFISLCRKICCDKQTHKTGFSLAVSFCLLKWKVLPFLDLNSTF